LLHITQESALVRNLKSAVKKILCFIILRPYNYIEEAINAKIKLFIGYFV